MTMMMILNDDAEKPTRKLCKTLPGVPNGKLSISEITPIMRILQFMCSAYFLLFVCCARVSSIPYGYCRKMYIYIYTELNKGWLGAFEQYCYLDAEPNWNSNASIHKNVWLCRK